MYLIRLLIDYHQLIYISDSVILCHRINNMEHIASNTEGFLTDYAQWTKKIGIEIAKKHSIEMTAQHWLVIDYLQKKHLKGETLSIREIKKDGIIDIKTLYHLYPGGALRISSKIAGVPKPKSCI